MNRHPFLNEDSFFKSLEMTDGGMLKAKALPVGTMRTWGGKKYHKVASGKWREVQKGKMAGKEKEIKSSGSGKISVKVNDSVMIKNPRPEVIDQLWENEKKNAKFGQVVKIKGNKIYVKHTTSDRDIVKYDLSEVERNKKYPDVANRAFAILNNYFVTEPVTAGSGWGDHDKGMISFDIVGVKGDNRFKLSSLQNHIVVGRSEDGQVTIGERGTREGGSTGFIVIPKGETRGRVIGLTEYGYGEFYDGPGYPLEKFEEYVKDLADKAKKQFDEYSTNPLEKKIEVAGYSLPEKRIDEWKERLQRGGSVEIERRHYVGGSSTTISKKPFFASQERAPQEMEEFFGVGPLFIHTETLD